MFRYIKEAILSTLLGYWKKIVGVLLLILGFCIFISASKAKGLSDFFIIFLLPLGILGGYILFRLIYEHVSENMFGETFGAFVSIIIALFGVVYVESSIWDTTGLKKAEISAIVIKLIMLSILWVIGIHLILQTYPLGSMKAITLLLRELQYTERQKLDWLQDGKTDYKVEVFKLDRVPNDIASINKDALPPKKISSVLRRFYLGERRNDKQRVLILIGSFGTGKSTALVNSVIQQLKNVFHGHPIPVYVKLRDCLKIEDITGDKLSSRDFFHRICMQYNSSANDTQFESFMEMLFTFHQNRKIIYIFDGLNEILQMTKSEGNPEVEAQHLVNYLYTFSAGNDCVLSFYPMPGIFTSQSLSIDNPNRIYSLYSIFGIAEAERAKKKAIANDESIANIPDSVAIFRMYERLEPAERIDKSTYDLIEITTETRLDALITGSRKEMITLEKLVESYLFDPSDLNTDISTPYSPIARTSAPDFTSLCDMRILQEHKSDDAGADQANTSISIYEYRFCHILIFEYFVTRVILNKLKDEQLSDAEIGKIKSILRGDDPEHLGHVHITEINRMTIEKLKGNQDLIHRLLSYLLPAPTKETFASEDELNYLAFLLKVGMDGKLLKDYIKKANHNQDLSSIIDVRNFKNEKLKITLLELCDCRDCIMDEMQKWDYSFVALKRDFFRKIEAIDHSDDTVQ